MFFSKYLVSISIGSYHCLNITDVDLESVESHDLCDEGYQFNADENVCVDIDECANDGDLCGASGVCVNREPGFECECDAGYAYDADARNCVDVNECYEDADRCGGDAGECVNTEGGFLCECNQGEPCFEYCSSRLNS